jgi:hypothetical protein
MANETIIPIDFFVEIPPVDQPAKDQELLNIIADSLGTTFASYSGQFILGQLGGTLPESNVGPWANGSEWWYWNDKLGAYSRTHDGVPIGTIMIWGGQGIPNNWLLCDGTEVLRTDFSLLFQVIGTDWGPGDGTSTFTLPPAAKFYMNAPAFIPDSRVPLDLNSPSSGWGTRGGAQLAPILTPPNIPDLKIKVPYSAVAKKTISGSSGGFTFFDFQASSVGQLIQPQLRDTNGELLNLMQPKTQIPIMPVFAAANFTIKYQSWLFPYQLIQ